MLRNSPFDAGIPHRQAGTAPPRAEPHEGKPVRPVIPARESRIPEQDTLARRTRAAGTSAAPRGSPLPRTGELPPPPPCGGPPPGRARTTPGTLPAGGTL